MGTRVVARESESPEFLILWKVAPEGAGSVSLDCRWGAGTNRGVLREPVESLVTPQLRFHPIQRALLCQTRAQRCCRFASMFGHVLQLALEFLLGDVDILRGSDAVHDQFGLHILRSPLPLPPPERHPIHIDRAGIHALCRQ